LQGRTGRFDPFAKPSADGRYLRTPDGSNRRKAAIAGRESGRRDWADSGPSMCALEGKIAPETAIFAIWPGSEI
jgi:hypothetical protein